MSIPRLALAGLMVVLAGCGNDARPLLPAAHLDHVVIVWLKDPGNQEHIAKLVEAAKALSGITGVASVEVGTCVKSERKIVDSSYDVGMVVSFANQADLNAYLIDPKHVALKDGVLTPLSARILVYDIATR